MRTGIRERTHQEFNLFFDAVEDGVQCFRGFSEWPDDYFIVKMIIVHDKTAIPFETAYFDMVLNGRQVARFTLLKAFPFEAWATRLVKDVCMRGECSLEVRVNGGEGSGLLPSLGPLDHVKIVGYRSREIR